MRVQITHRGSCQMLRVHYRISFLDAFGKIVITQFLTKIIQILTKNVDCASLGEQCDIVRPEVSLSEVISGTSGPARSPDVNSKINLNINNIFYNKETKSIDLLFTLNH